MRKLLTSFKQGMVQFEFLVPRLSNAVSFSRDSLLTLSYNEESVGILTAVDLENNVGVLHKSQLQGVGRKNSVSAVICRTAHPTHVGIVGIVCVVCGIFSSAAGRKY